MSVAAVGGLLKKISSIRRRATAWRWVALASVLNFEIWRLNG
jgi:hypothetical protein